MSSQHFYINEETDYEYKNNCKNKRQSFRDLSSEHNNLKMNYSLSPLLPYL